MYTATNIANGLLLSPSPVEAPIYLGFFIGIGTPIQTSTQERRI